MKDYRRPVYWMIAIAAVNLIAMLCVVRGLPDVVPEHFNFRFEVDRMGSKWFLMLVPAIALLVTAGISVEERLRGRDYANNKPLTIFAVCFAALFIVLGWMMYALCSTGAQMGEVVTDVPFDLVICLGMSALFIVMGNYLPIVRQNRTFGIKMRATFENEEVWRRVNRFGGTAYVIAGCVSAVLALVGYCTGVKWLELVGLVASVLGASLAILIYSKRVEGRVK